MSSCKKGFYTQSIQEMWRSDIATSRNTKEIYKIFEFFDDYTYGLSKNMGIYIYNKGTSTKQIPCLALFMEEGPDNETHMGHLLSWRKSGNSQEIGHKGGGNLRNIYGHYSHKTSLFSRRPDNECIYAYTRPNDIYILVDNEKTTESECRTEINTSTYMKRPETMHTCDLPAWYSNLYDKISTESKIKPGFIITMELSITPEEYSNKETWYKFINELGLKQYAIPIYYKNERIGDTEYTMCKNIDLLGESYALKQTTLKVYVNVDGTKPKVYLENENATELINVKDKTKITPSVQTSNKWTNCKYWGTLKMFTIEKKQLKKHLAQLNTTKKYYTENDFYGVYLRLNNKLTNFIPVESSGIAPSKNNSIIGNGTVCFRVILSPDTAICTDKSILSAILITDTIKALTKFSDNCPNKSLLKTAVTYFINDAFIVKKKIRVKNPNPKVDGGVYIVYIGKGLWKYGMVDIFKRVPNRITEHRRKGAEYINKFLKYKLVDISERDICKSVSQKWKTKTPAAAEELIGSLLLKWPENITIFQSNASDNKAREYFKCDLKYFIETVLPDIDYHISS